MIGDNVPRDSLMRGMRSAAKHIYLAAPGGYGKTTAAAEWLSGLRGKTVTLTVRDADNDPSVFYSRLSRAMAELTGKVREQSSLDGLLEAIRLLPKRDSLSYLLIDDLQMLKNEVVTGSLPQIVARLPDYVRLCFVSRSEPDTALLEKGRFEVFTQSDLRFSDGEIAWLGAGKGRDLTKEQIRSLQEMTGGWVMYLSVLLSGKGYDEIPHTLIEYLDKRVWVQWNTETKLLLLRLSIPAEVTPELVLRLTGQTDGKYVLTQLTGTENAFLSNVYGDTYRFHDIFRDFLHSRMDDFLSKEEKRRLNEIVAEWYYERRDYFMSIRYFFQNRDHDGVIRCECEITQYHAKTENISVETTCNFISNYILSLPASFVMENNHLVLECSYGAFLDGNTEDFIYYKDMLSERMPEIAEQHPDLVETAGFLFSLDFQIPIVDYARHLAAMLPQPRCEPQINETETVHTNTITQNLPFFHRSMRDYSEIFELKEEDLELFRNTFGVMIGRDYKVMEQSLIAGIYYERGQLLPAAYHALAGFRACGKLTNPETQFSASMILAAILYAMGATVEAERIMSQIGEYIEKEAMFLRSNFKALQTERHIRDGDTDAAKEWIEIYACLSENLPFYQICRHFTTLRSHIILGEYELAVRFAYRLQKLTEEYNRPLDQIECLILTAIAVWRSGVQDEAIRNLRHAADIAMHYGFVQLFINEGKEILPLLWQLRDSVEKPGDYSEFIDKLTEGVFEKHGLAKGKITQLSAQQRAMLPLLSRGMSYREIADATGIGFDTVKSHVRLVYRKLGVHSAEEAVIKAKAQGLLG